jgi:hypothetical protein
MHLVAKFFPPTSPLPVGQLSNSSLAATQYTRRVRSRQHRRTTLTPFLKINISAGTSTASSAHSLPCKVRRSFYISLSVESFLIQCLCQDPLANTAQSRPPASAGSNSASTRSCSVLAPGQRRLKLLWVEGAQPWPLANPGSNSAGTRSCSVLAPSQRRLKLLWVEGAQPWPLANPGSNSAGTRSSTLAPGQPWLTLLQTQRDQEEDTWCKLNPTTTLEMVKLLS